MTLLAVEHFQALHIDRAIDAAIIRERGYQTWTSPAEVVAHGFSTPQSRTVPALGIPLWNVHREQTGWQIRPDMPRFDGKGKPRKYENRPLPDGRLLLDVHPRLVPLLRDPREPLFVTEGTPKGDSLASQDVCCLALSGVWGFRGSNEYGGKVILPDWQYVPLNGREVIVVYDNDVMAKDQVAAALKALVTFLVYRQARPALVRWPEALRGEKVGIDDYLAQGHTLTDVLALVVPVGNRLTPRLAPAQRNGHALQPESRADALLTDTYNARAFVADHGHTVRYCYPWDAWLVWTNTHWERDTSGEVMRLAKETVKRLAHRIEGLSDEKQIAEFLAHIKSSLSTSRLEALVRNARSEAGIAVQPQDLDTHPWLLNCTNGTLDLRTGTLRPHRQGDLLTRCLAIAYDPEARCPQWVEFLDTVMRHQPELIAFLQKALGYSLTGSTREQCFFLLHGITKTGKSTFLHIAKALLGPYGTQAEMSTFVHKDRETVRNDLADLAGMRLVCAIETDQGKRLAEALIKQLTGGTDMIKARFLFEEYFEYRPQFKVFLATNHKPKMNAADDALWERVHPIPFAVHIPQNQRDKHLESKLLAELPGILAWAVRGCMQWQADDSLGEPAAVRASKQQYRDEMDTLGQFLDECCIPGDAAYVKVKATTLARAYQAWCKHAGTMPLDNLAFIAALEARNYTRQRGHANQYYWHGVGLVTIEDTADD
jgi:putative DNA primase/helicase